MNEYEECPEIICSSDKVSFLSVNRFERKKRVELAIEAFADTIKLVKAKVGVVLLIAKT